MKPNKSIVHPYAGKDLADAIVNAVYNCFQFMTDAGLCSGIANGITKVSSPSSRLSTTESSNKKLLVGNAINRLRKMK